MRKSPSAETVEGYLELLPEEVSLALEKLRKIIKAAAPGTTEVISYRIPVFKYQGRPSGRLRRGQEPLLVLHDELQHDSQTGAHASRRTQRVRCQRCHDPIHT